MRPVVIAALAGARIASADGYHASVELADKGGAPHAIISTKLTCNAPAKCPQWTLDLGRADAVAMVALVDLLGPPTRVRDVVDLHQLALDLAATAKLPAAFVRIDQTDAANARWERWAIVTIDAGKPAIAWRGEIAMTNARGGGFATPDGIELIASEPGKPLALAFVQATVPATAKARGGAHRRFELEAGTYQRK